MNYTVILLVLLMLLIEVFTLPTGGEKVNLITTKDQDLDENSVVNNKTDPEPRLEENGKRHQKRRRKKRNDYPAADQYVYDYDYNYEDDNIKEHGFFEKWDTKLTKKYIITVAIVGNICLCLCCTLCMLICTFCKESYYSAKKNTMIFFDAFKRRDDKYREICDCYRRLDLKPPTYEDYELVKNSLM